MAISAIQSSPAFTGKIKTTKEGNEYKKTNAGKYIGTGLGAASGVASTMLLSKMLKSELKGNKEAQREFLVFINETAGKLKKSPDVLKKITTNKILKISAGVAVAIVTIGGLINGAIIDKIVNHSRAKKADKAAQQA